VSAVPVIVPDNVTVSFALFEARRRGGILQTNGRRNVINASLLPGYARVAGGGDRAATLQEATQPHAPEAA
jgi:hypothetical protein